MKRFNKKNSTMVKAAFCVALFSASVFSTPAIWDGSADVSWYDASAQTYNLTTAEQLAGLAKLVNQGTSSFEGKTITLGADIFLNDTAGITSSTWEKSSRNKWTPIGSYSRPFKGEFDGIAGKNNRKILGLYIKNTSSNYMGFFGYTNNVKISNLDVLGGYITAKNNTGALVGYADGGTISNVHSDVNVTGSNHVGGLVGYSKVTITASSAKGIIAGQDSVGGLVGITTGSVSGSSKNDTYFMGSVTGRKYIGGLIGAGESVSKCYASGTVKGDSSYVGGIAGNAKGNVDSVYHIGGDVNGSGYVGGLVGLAAGDVKNSYSEGTVIGKSSYVGGLAGYVSGTIENSYHINGDVSGKGNVGGIAGLVEKAISNSYSEGIITGSGDYVGGVAGNVLGTIVSAHHVDGNVEGVKYVGGLAGSAAGNVKNSYSEGTVSGKAYVGGILGAADSSASLSKVYSIGNVHADSSYVGGVVGYATGTIDSVHHSEGDVTGDDDYVGGVAGYAKKTIDSAYHIGGDVSGYGYVGGLAGRADSAIERSYVEGNVTGGQLSSDRNHRNYVGGLVGIGNRISSSYHKNGKVLGDGGNVGGLAGYIKGNNRKTYFVPRDEIPEIFNSYNIGEVECTHTGSWLCEKTGGLVGELYEGEIVESYSEGSVRSDRNYVGGLIGYSHYPYSPIVKMYSCGSSGNQTTCFDNEPDGSPIYFIKNSYFKGDVYGYGYVGGLVGYDSLSTSAFDNTAKTTAKVYRIILNSYSKGNVYGKSAYSGGLIGQSVYLTRAKFDVYAKIDSSYHVNGNIGTKGDSYGYRGGLAGETYYSIFNSYSKGDVFGYEILGGLVGFFHNANSSVNETIKNSYSEGNVDGYGSMVGGLVGDAWHVSIYDSHSIGNINGGVKTGGLIGYSTNGNSSVSNSYSLGSVKGGSHTGGLIGYGPGESVNNSYSIGNVSGGDSCVGGVAGYVKSISGSYSSGDVIGKRKYIGGVVGYATGNVTSSYHIAGNIEGKTYIGGVAGKADGTIRIVSHTEGDIKGDGSYSYVGGIVGYAGSSIDSAVFKGGKVDGGTYVGGIVGYASKSVNRSHSEGDVTGTKKHIGGLAGQVVDSVMNSCSKGSVLGTKNFVGGLAGQIGGSIVNSCSEGNVTTQDDQVGGLVGQIDGSIENSYSRGDVSGVDSVGGLAGVVKGIVKNSYVGATNVKGRNAVGGLIGYALESIKNSYFSGDSVTGLYQVGGFVGYAAKAVDSTYSTANVKGDDNVGGLIGSAYGNISNSYALGNVDGDVDNSSAGNDNLGGLVGYQYSGSVSKSMALGNVNGTTKLGGLVGRFDGTSISQSYANGNVVGDYYGNPADEVGNYYIGGLVGYAKGAVNESYASGVVKGIEEGPVYTGCIVGYVNGSLSVTKTYYDKSKCNLGIDGGENTATITGNPAKTTEEMQTQSTFVDWDFTNTWRIEKNTYPFLQIFANSLINAVVLTESLEGFEYDGFPKAPQVTAVTLYGDALTENVDYAVKYERNVNAGTAKISVCGLNPYSGCKAIKFEIAPKAILPTISAIEDVVYTGWTMTPEISVYNGETLLDASDYTVEYSDNVNAGTASVAITMKENYSGSAIKTFTIGKANPVITQNPGASDITVGSTLALSDLANGTANVPGSFAWKNPEIIPALENEGYVVVFTPNDGVNYNSVEMTVPVKVWDVAYVTVHVGERSLDSAVVVKGTDYTLPKVPDSIGYDFAGFFLGDSAIGLSGDVISVSENTVIDAKYSIKIFAVNFMNGETELQLDSLPYGSLPEYVGSMPIKAASAKYTYPFKGWNPAIETVSKSATYTAVFDSVVNKYVITFMDGNTELQSGEVEYGTIPSYKGTVPTKKETKEYTYTFKGWNPRITAVTGKATYKALFDSTLQKYTVVFKNGNDKLQTISVAYGETPKYTGKTPTKKSTNDYSYEFVGWSPKLGPVAKETEFYAIFDSTKVTGIMAGDFANLGMSVNVVSRNIQISAAPVGKAYALFDMQGRVLQKGRVESVNYNIVAPCAGSYFIRIGSQTRAVEVK
ncbi:MAG: hypothetical protein IJM92_07060 [Fibrobacter sp.]|uniref:beta strand repeat-containing protein n=1 Tax=Fibrobacter sp. TaxID=35828 RepID=UPI0025C2307B|nr:GLUG motif-containing protein [Fibrobacter sp.]MBQ3716534.1 hypothetical protein [Fibrobacter sp.]MBQ7079410.1 hypothetical protein [Fibrobacter sp.]